MKRFESRQQSNTNGSGDGITDTVWLNMERYYIKIFEFLHAMNIYNTFLVLQVASSLTALGIWFWG